MIKAVDSEEERKVQRKRVQLQSHEVTVYCRGVKHKARISPVKTPIWPLHGFGIFFTLNIFDSIIYVIDQNGSSLGLIPIRFLQYTMRVHLQLTLVFSDSSCF